MSEPSLNNNGLFEMSELGVDETSTTPGIVSEQPRRDRTELPVYTIGWSSISHSPFTAVTGLDFLYGVPELDIIQTALNFNPKSSPKRYIIKIPYGETLYLGLENSTQLQRTLCGSQRGFHMTLTDPTQQVAAYFNRKLRTSINCFCGVLQELEVFTENNDRIGVITLNFSIVDISFSVWDGQRNLLYVITAPIGSCTWFMPLEANFPICNTLAKVGEISRKWDLTIGDYVLRLSFPAPCVEVRQKMLLIAATLLIEYCYYEHRKESCIRIC